MTRSISTSAPGKIILCGEHFVVHGSYSLAAAISRRVYVSVREIEGTRSRIVANGLTSIINSDDRRFPAVKTVARMILSGAEKKFLQRPFEIAITSEIPPGSGLGSSSAVSVACAAALKDFLEQPAGKENIADIALQGERAVHGNPSGIDIQASFRGGLILFKKGQETRSIELSEPFRLLVVFSGRKRSTSRLIAKVAQTKSEYPHYFQRLADSASQQSLAISNIAKTGEIEKMGPLFATAQAQLAWIGVSTPQLERLMEYLYGREEVLGVKLTGAGGGGSVIVAVRQDSIDSVLRFVSGRYPYSFISEIPQEGLRWEKMKI
jgi:mevalonate kinase